MYSDDDDGSQTSTSSNGVSSGSGKYKKRDVLFFMHTGQSK